MSPTNRFEFLFNSSAGFDSFYIPHLSIRKLETITETIVLVIYLIVLLVSIIQTFWKNKRIDHVLTYMNEAYSNGRFRSNQVSFRYQIMTCYRFGERISHIPNPNRLILLIITIHIQVLVLIAMKTLFIRRNEVINDCSWFPRPYEILQCEDDRDPCRFNDTATAPKCIYYQFELTHLITMVTSIVTWHSALRYIVIELIRFFRWILFRDDDQPRRLCCYCRITPHTLQCVMYFLYINFWLYILLTVLLGFIWHLSLFHISISSFGFVWMPVIIAGERLCSLILGLIPELLQNWLVATSNGKVLVDLQSKGLLFTQVEPLIYLTTTKTKSSTSTNTVAVSAAPTTDR